MIAKINEMFVYSKSILQNFGSTYSGIYLALFGLFFFFLYFKRIDLSIKSYTAYMLGFLVLFFVPGCIPLINFMTGVDLSVDTYMMFPTIIVMIIAFVTLVLYLKEDSEKNGGKYYVIKASAVFLLLIFVEASVPLQIDFTEFSLPKWDGKYASTVSDITEIVGEQSVMLPSELQSAMKRHQWNLNMPISDTTDYDEDATSVFQNAYGYAVTYVVVKEKKQLDVSNQDTLVELASVFHYGYITKTGGYLIFALS